MFLLTCPQISHEDTPTKKLRLSKPSKSAALHIDLCKATNSTDALQYLLQFARKSVEADSVEGVIRILLEHYYKVDCLNPQSGEKAFIFVIEPSFLLLHTGAR